MARREFSHTVDDKGRVTVTETPRHLRGLSEDDCGTYTENVITRRVGEAAGSVARSLFGRKGR